MELRSDMEKRLYHLEKAMNGSYTKMQKKIMGEEIVKLNKLLKEAEGESSKELSENEGVKAMVLMAVFTLIVVAISAVFLYGIIGGTK